MQQEKKSLTFQLVLMAGFLFFFYMFFALASSIYRDYKLESEIGKFEAEIDKLALAANQKPKDLMYLQSDEYKDLYGKESLNLLNPGEEWISVPKPEENIEEGPVELTPEVFSPEAVLNQPNPIQWKEYFFGQTLSVEPQSTSKTTPPESPIPAEENKEAVPEPEPVEG